MRRLIAFPCADETLFGSLDEAPAKTGLLIVSGGNEIRCGAHRGMALLAARVAEAGYPVLRFDRRGIGDSTGENGGFETTAQDIAAAATALRETGVTRILAFGNCDAATALAFFHAQANIDALLLANPWTIEATDDLPPAAAIRSHYVQRLKDPKEWVRLLRGGVNISKIIRGLTKASQKQSQAPETLAARLGTALASAPPTTILLAKGDNTAIAFADAYKGPAFEAARARVAIETLDSDSHSFASVADKDWLFERVLTALA
ncbi:MAG: hydrolase 1, exosortase A system-associated [Sphingomonadales bacterium]|nr:MAG: hydrolase 1, exosortase A system-associated [Sphingomonadales bacterium]